MQCHVGFKTESIELKKAVLIYGPKTGSYGMYGDGACYASIHPVSIDSEGRSRIESGRPIGVDETNDILMSIKGSEPLRLMDKRVIAKNGQKIVFWVKGEKRATWLDCEGEEPQMGTVWHPSLIFVAGENGIHVLAYKGRKAPTAKTIIYKPPYLNARQDGSMCMGNRKLPKAIESEIDGVISAFFTSAFTHALNSGLVKYEGGVYALWFDLIAGKHADSFPEECMVPLQTREGKDVTLEMLLEFES